MKRENAIALLHLTQFYGSVKALNDLAESTDEGVFALGPEQFVEFVGEVESEAASDLYTYTIEKMADWDDEPWNALWGSVKNIAHQNQVLSRFDISPLRAMMAVAASISAAEINGLYTFDFEAAYSRVAKAVDEVFEEHPDLNAQAEQNLNDAASMAADMLRTANNESK